jgi:hypothetical protein
MVPVVLLRRWSRWFLLALYFCISFFVAAVADIQAGGNINYFFECLFAITPFAALGVFWLWKRTSDFAAAFLCLLILGVVVVPSVSSTASMLREATDTGVVNRDLSNLRRALGDLNVFSVVGVISHLAPTVVITEPFLLSYLERSGNADSAPWAARIRQREFDVLITHVEAASYRGVPFITPKIRAAIEESYEPFCTCRGALFFARRQENPESLFKQRFAAIGCRRISCPSTLECHGW